jgi:hypothetical protein
MSGRSPAIAVIHKIERKSTNNQQAGINNAFQTFMVEAQNTLKPGWLWFKALIAQVFGTRQLKN